MHLKTIPENEEDEKLISFIQKGNIQAFTITYERYHKMLYALAYKYIKDADTAKDAVQYVFVKLWENHASLLITINLKNYLYTMTRNYILNYIRNENSAIVHNYQMLQESDDYEDNLIEIIEKKELMEFFYKAMELLPQQKRAICLYKIDNKLSNQEIAEEMNLSIATVKTHYAQAIKLLRNHLNKMLIFISLIHLC